ncbi:MAG: hypothetical protein GY759_03535 [Chloroflexi bacterium]|nr:hypothetical protein [Chloroflexota bacterium]
MRSLSSWHLRPTGALAIFDSYEALIIWFVVLVTVGEMILFPHTPQQRADAAGIQELFDCNVLELAWNDALTRKPDPKTIELAIARFDNRKDSEQQWQALKDWFESPQISTLPLHQARIVCQKENIRWDSGQRREWARWLFIGIAAFVALLIAIGILADWPMQKFFVGPVLLSIPLIIAIYNHSSEHKKAAERLEHLEEVVAQLWHDACQQDADIDAITRRTRNVQNEIYRHRRENVPVFDWFYNKLGNKYAPPSSTANAEP